MESRVHPPEKFDVYVKVDCNTIFNGKLEHLGDHGNYIQHVILRGFANRQVDPYTEKFTLLRRSYLDAVIRQDKTAIVLNELQNRGIIERNTYDDGNPHYIIGKQCSGYRISDKYLSKPTLRIPVFNRFIKRRKDAISLKQNKKLNPTCRWLRHWLDEVTICGGMESIHGIMNDMAEDYASDPEHKLSKREYLTQLELTASIIHHKEHDFIRDDYGRVHSVFTRMRKDLRSHLLVDGKPLVNIDVANSQPLFMGMAMVEDAYGIRNIGLPSWSFSKQSKEAVRSSIVATLSDPMIFERTLSRLQEIISSVTFPDVSAEVSPKVYPVVPLHSRNPKSPSKSSKSINYKSPFFQYLPTMPYPYDKQFAVSACKSSSGKSGKQGKKPFIPFDVSAWLTWCQSGRLYQFLMAGIGVTDKNEFKSKYLFKVLYGQNKDADKLSCFIAINFPAVWAWMRKKKQEKGYANLAHLMQRSESKFMIEGVCNRLRIEHPGMKIITIHDSIMTNEANVQTVIGIMMDEFKKIGYVPTIRVEGADTTGMFAATT